MVHVKWSGVLVLCALLAGCGGGKQEQIDRALAAPIEVEAIPNEDVDFSKYKTYGWFPVPNSGDSRIDDPMFRQAVGDAVDQYLTARGYTHNQNKPDMLINGFAAINTVSGSDLADYYAKNYPEYDPLGKSGMVKTEEFQAGSLFVMVFDASTRAMVYNSQAHAEVFGFLPEEAMRQRVNRAVKMMLEKFPSRTSS